MPFQSIQSVNVKNKTVLIRLDLNVPIQNGQISDTTRLERSLETLQYLKTQGAKTIITAHLGRPKGVEAEHSLKPVCDKLSQLLGSTIHFCPHTIGQEATHAASTLKSGEFLMLENLRFHKEEEKNDPHFAKSLASLAEIYVNDAFSVSHRAHASVEGITHYLPATAGFLMANELQALEKALSTPTRPVMAIVGGSKVSTKVDLLQNLITKVDVLVIGGGMANTFLLAQGKDIAASFCDRESTGTAQEILKAAEGSGCHILLPIDGVVAEKLEEGVHSQTCSVSSVPAGTMILDIGSKSVQRIKDALQNSKTVVWNGPLGVFETKPFDQGTNAVAQAIAQATRNGQIVSIAGGGDTVSALNQAGVSDDFSYVSTAGGAFLEWMEGKTLPGVAALEKSQNKKAA